MEIKKVTDPSFRKYGKVLDINVTELVEAMQALPCPSDAVVYEPGDASLEALPVYEEFQRVVYGQMPVQVGYCNGTNQKMNAVEYHRCSEINVGATDAILLVGWLPDVKDDFTYDSSLIEAFFLPKGTAVQIYETTLHYAPCGIDGAPFRVTIVLPKETNYALETPHGATGEDRLLAARNKWLIAHKDGGCGDDAFVGIIGENVSV